MIVMDPETFGRYGIVRKLQGGGMGRVYLVIDTEVNRQVALKLIDLAPDQDSQEVLEAERVGAALQARLSAIDPRVARIYEVGERAGYFFIAMEYVEGRDLSEVLVAGPLPPARAVAIGIDICDVLANAHTLRASLDNQEYYGIVHGDIKPRNIRITPEGKVKVLDFGISKALSLTRKFTHNQFGSVPYSSPERLSTGQVDAASDVWSAAIVLYEMLQGRPYFQAENAAKLEQTIRSYRVLQPSLLNIPEGLRQILGKALDPIPRQRYASAQALRADLQAFQEGKPVNIPFEAAADADRTRRTAKPPTPRRGLPLHAIKTRFKSARTIAQVAFVGIVAYGSWNEVRVWKQGDQLKHELDSERLTDMNTAWARYESLSGHSNLPVVLNSPRNSLREKLVSYADRIINEYRDNDTPTVREKDWQRAQGVLAKALELSPGDKKVKGKLRLCEGHISRIRGVWNEAKAKFDEARDLMPKSPDSHLGLARLYVYGLKDIEKAEKEMREAERHGHPMGKREKAQLADGYRDRGDAWVREAERAPNQSQEEEYLRRADDDYARSEDLYQEITPFGNASTMLGRIYISRDSVAGRLRQLKDKS